jgi:hypothetical protein
VGSGQPRRVRRWWKEQQWDSQEDEARSAQVVRPRNDLRVGCLHLQCNRNAGLPNTWPNWVQASVCRAVGNVQCRRSHVQAL